MKVVAYLTQYDYWWSVTLPQWERLVVLGLQGAGYELREPYAKDLARMPSSVRVSSDRSTGRKSYWAPVPVIRPLDFDASDWRYADEQVRRHIEMRGRP
jgi:hypothetical protein